MRLGPQNRAFQGGFDKLQLVFFAEMPSGYDPERLFVGPNLPRDRKIQVFQLRTACLHIRQLTFQYHNSLITHNQQVHLAMPRPVQIGKLKPLTVFRAGDRRRKGFFIPQPRCFRPFRPSFRDMCGAQTQRCVMQPHNRTKSHAAPLGFFGANTFRSSTHNRISPFRASSTNSALGVSFGAYRKKPSDLTGNGPSSSRRQTRSSAINESLYRLTSAPWGGPLPLRGAF